MIPTLYPFPSDPIRVYSLLTPRKQSVWGDTHGCISYDYYLEDGLDVPRCDLYGSSVAYALASIDNNEPHTWFDLACGDPESSTWTHLSS